MEQGAGPLKAAGTTRRIIEALAGQHPNADTELAYRNAFELLVATVLSAQSTDAGVNQVTPALFARYPDAEALAPRLLREQRRISQEEIAFAAEVTQASISNYENGRNEIPLSVLLAVCDYLGVPLAEMLPMANLYTGPRRESPTPAAAVARRGIRSERRRGPFGWFCAHARPKERWHGLGVGRE